VQRSQQPAADHARYEPDRRDQGGDRADAGTLADAALAWALSWPRSLRAKTPMASPCATPDSFRSSAATSADSSFWKIAKTTVSFDMDISLRQFCVI